MFDFSFFQHFGNCHGELTTIAGVVTALAGGSAGVAVFRNRLSHLPLIGRFFKPRHDCCDHTPPAALPHEPKCPPCSDPKGHDADHCPECNVWWCDDCTSKWIRSPKVERCRACEAITEEDLCICLDGGSAVKPFEEKCWVCDRFLYCTSCREARVTETSIEPQG